MGFLAKNFYLAKSAASSIWVSLPFRPSISYVVSKSVKSQFGPGYILRAVARSKNPGKGGGARSTMVGIICPPFYLDQQWKKKSFQISRKINYFVYKFSFLGTSLCAWRKMIYTGRRKKYIHRTSFWGWKNADSFYINSIKLYCHATICESISRSLLTCYGSLKNTFP